MCVNEYGSQTVNGRTQQYFCPNQYDQWFLDCGDNDYFNASRTISSSNYLYNHWNTANSGWLHKF
jgi:hypothetical protein